MQQIPGQSFREFLRNELKNRSSNNPSFSLRSFARTLGVSPSGLSMVMAGKKPVTLGFIETVGTKLKLNAEDLQKHQISLLTEKSQKRLDLRDFQFIEEGTFNIVKDWYHYAILNLMRTKDFKPSASWIAKRLGISLGEVQSAVERLQKAGFLKISKGDWTDLTNNFTSHTNNKKFSEAAKHNQIQLFEKAKAAIEEVEFQKRNHTGVTVAVRQQDMEAAKDFITLFRKQFMERFDRRSDADEVYQMSVALFPLTKLK